MATKKELELKIQELEAEIKELKTEPKGSKENPYQATFVSLDRDKYKNLNKEEMNDEINKLVDELSTKLENTDPNTYVYSSEVKVKY